MSRSSRKLIVIAIAVIMTFLLIPTTSCSSHDKLRTISAKSLFDGEYATFKIMAHDVLPGVLEGFGYVTFSSYKSFDEIFESVTNDTDMSAAKYPEAIFFSRISGENKQYYCLSKIPKSNKQYVFGGMLGFAVDDMASDPEHEGKWILFPIHLMTDERLFVGTMPRFTLLLNTDYKLSGTKEEIVTFYRDCGWYDVDVADDLISITGFSRPVETMVGALHGEEVKNDVPFDIKLTEKEDGLYFSVITAVQKSHP